MFAQIGGRDRNQPINRAPASVQQSFHKDNPNTNDVRWSQTNHEWHANYMDNNKRNVDAYYDRDGVRKTTYRALDRTEVPRDLHNNITKMYGSNGNYTAARIERPNQQSLFEIKIHSGKNYRTVYMDEQGRKRPYNDRH